MGAELIARSEIDLHEEPVENLDIDGLRSVGAEAITRGDVLKLTQVTGCVRELADHHRNIAVDEARIADTLMGTVCTFEAAGYGITGGGD